MLFWVNSFCFLFEPRQKVYLPFLTYAFQDEAMLACQQSLGREDVLIEKSRCMGATWMCLAVFLHDFLYHPHGSYAVISRSQDLVESPGDPDCLFWKLDCLVRHLPNFVKPELKRAELHYENLDLGGTIDGFSTTGNVLRGGRRTAALVDEFAAFERADGYAALAATQAATPCRIFNSTPQGATGAFYDMAQSGIRKLRLHWSAHPVYNVDAYTGEDGKVRSPWYDKECRRMPIPALIGQELDIDYAGSASQFFDQKLLDRLIQEHTIEPFHRGRLEWVPGETPLWIDDPRGEISLWVYLTDGKLLTGEEYIVGADIGNGTGATPSVLSIAEKLTGEKIGEVATAKLSPDDFARLTVGVCRFFNNAYLIHEMNGPGVTYGKAIIEKFGYGNMYFRRNEQSLEKKEIKSGVPGWFSTKDNKRDLLTRYAACLKEAMFVNHSEKALNECRTWIFNPSGTISSARAESASDPSEARENHSDRVIADALACKGVCDFGMVKAEVKSEFDPNNPPVGSFAWRRKEAEDSRKTSKHWTANKKPWNAPLSIRGR